VLVHGHFYYPDSLDDLLNRLAKNTVKFDLILTTDTADKASTLSATAAEHELNATVKVVPNLGRNVGPLLAGLAGETLAPYELLLHVHGKKSTHVNESVGDSWRDFLFDSLVAAEIGDQWVRSADHIVAAFEAEPKLGLVFAEDAHLNGWDDNLVVARGLGRRMRLGTLPLHFDFPIGGMFWARTKALQPLLALSLGWEDFPSEPLPIDGTMLHAIERLFPLVARSAGYGYATSYVEGVVR
jgi:lipopolysaccharide biosynthesis protein